MSTIKIQLDNLSVVEIPLQLLPLIEVKYKIVNNSDTFIPAYLNSEPAGKDPFGLSKPIKSSNKKN